ncbi:MAG TPA: dihydropteroate synthase [Microbacteriaceae bacterium]|nr:dihydropteroate synthase [Microbacteriaceae bacterium]
MNRPPSEQTPPLRPLVFGVLNVTPDSFSDGGEHFDAEAAIAHGRSLVAEGADWVDVGGESTAPGTAPVTPEEEQRRVLPVIAALAGDGIRVSIDTYHATTAAAAIGAGARIVNDVYGIDPAMPAVIADSDVRYVTMHSFGEPTTPHHYDDVLAEVRAELLRRVDALQAVGVAPEQIVLDPGLGFSKAPEENWALLRGTAVLAATGYPVLIGTSRKRFIRRLVGDPLADRDLATAVTSALAARSGAWAVRVHDVRATRIALDVEGAWSTPHPERDPQDRAEGATT